MRNESDDEIILQDSPLHQYLLQNDLDCCSSVISKSQGTYVSAQDGERSSLGLEASPSACENTVKGSWAKWPVFRLLDRFNEDLRISSVSYCCNVMRSFGLLDSDDELRLGGKLDTYLDTGKQRTFQELSFRFWSMVLAWCLPCVLISCTCAITGQFWTCILVSGLGLAGLFSAAQQRRHWSNFMSSVESFSNAFRQTDRICRSGLQLLRDNEVLARGHLLASGKLGSASQILSDGPGQGLVCKPLRIRIFEAAKNLCFVWKKELENINKLRTEEDGAETSLVSAFSTLNSIFTSRHLETEEWLSTEALKTLWQFFRLLLSEHASSTLELVLDGNLQPKDFISQIGSLQMELQNSGQKLEKERCKYDYKEESGANWKGRTPPPAPSTACVAAHSLCLHLHSALNKAVELESAMLSDSPSDLPMDDIRRDLSASLACLEKLQLPKPDNENLQPKDSKLEKNQEKQCIVIPEDFEVAIKDQVFEGYVEKPACEAETDVMGEDSMGSKDESGERSLVLTELKSVLAVRSEQVHRREMEALAAFRGVSLADVLEEENAIQPVDTEDKGVGVAAPSQTPSDSDSDSEDRTEFKSEFSRLIADKFRNMSIAQCEKSFTGRGELQ